MAAPRLTWLNPASPAGYAELLIRNRVDRARRRAHSSPADVGASVVEWVIISALVIVIAGTVGGILLTKLTAKANDLDLTTPNP
jgi:hypothetical protein